MLIEAGVLTVAFGVAAARSMYVLNPGQSAVRMFMGKVRGFETTPGLHIKKPWEKLTKLDTKQLYKDLVLENVKMEDGKYVTLPVQLQYRITDPGKFLFNANDPEHQMYSQVEAVVKSQAAQMTFDVLYKSRDDLEKAVEEHERAAVEQKYGITLDRVIPGDPKPSDAVLEAINEGIRLQESAKGRAAALIIEAEATADGRAIVQRKNAVLHKELVDSGMSSEVADAFALINIANETLREAANKGNMIITTTDSNSQLEQFAGLVKKFSGPQQSVTGALNGTASASAASAHPADAFMTPKPGA